MNLYSYRASILTLLFEKLPIGTSVSYVDFSLLGDDVERHCVAHAKILSDQYTVHVVFTLPSKSSNVFLALTEQKIKEVTRLLANLEDYEEENGLVLQTGEVVVIPDPQEPSAGLPYAVIALPIGTSLDCAALPTRMTIDGKLTAFHLIVPLTMGEWAIRKQRGHDALIDHFAATGKALLF